MTGTATLPLLKRGFLQPNLLYIRQATRFYRFHQTCIDRIALAVAIDATDFAPELFDESQKTLIIFHAPEVSRKLGAIQFLITKSILTY